MSEETSSSYEQQSSLIENNLAPKRVLNFIISSLNNDSSIKFLNTFLSNKLDAKKPCGTVMVGWGEEKICINIQVLNSNSRLLPSYSWSVQRADGVLFLGLNDFYIINTLGEWMNDMKECIANENKLFLCGLLKPEKQSELSELSEKRYPLLYQQILDIGFRDIIPMSFTNYDQVCGAVRRLIWYALGQTPQCLTSEFGRILTKGRYFP